MNKNDFMKKHCENCRFFLQHYTKGKVKFQSVYCGHCINANVKSKKKKHPDDLCEFWEDMSIKKEERLNSIKKNFGAYG